MKTIVVYTSKSGYVKNYAEWIAEELSADISEVSKLSIDTLIAYETIIYGGGLYAVGINGIKLITKNFSKLKNKNIIVFASGVTPYRDDILTEIKNSNFSLEQQDHIKFFYLRGGFEFNRLTRFDKCLMQLLKYKLKIKSDLTPDEKGMLAAYDTPVDFTSKKNIVELVTYVSSLQ